MADATSGSPVASNRQGIPNSRAYLYILVIVITAGIVAVCVWQGVRLALAAIHLPHLSPVQIGLAVVWILVLLVLLKKLFKALIH